MTFFHELDGSSDFWTDYWIPHGFVLKSTRSHDIQRNHTRVWNLKYSSWSSPINKVCRERGYDKSVSKFHCKQQETVTLGGEKYGCLMNQLASRWRHSPASVVHYDRREVVFVTATWTGACVVLWRGDASIYLIIYSGLYGTDFHCKYTTNMLCTLQIIANLKIMPKFIRIILL